MPQYAHIQLIKWLPQYLQNDRLIEGLVQDCEKFIAKILDIPVLP